MGNLTLGIVGKQARELCTAAGTRQFKQTSDLRRQYMQADMLFSSLAHGRGIEKGNSKNSWPQAALNGKVQAKI